MWNNEALQLDGHAGDAGCTAHTYMEEENTLLLCHKGYTLLLGIFGLSCWQQLAMDN